MARYYLLNKDKTIREVNLADWALFFNEAGHDRRVADSIIEGYRVSTVFLGLDHSYTEDSEPLVFETMIFSDTPGDYNEKYCERYSSFTDALKRHQTIVCMLEDGDDSIFYED